MEIPEMNMISDFEAGMKCLQNPSLISRFFSFQLYTFWKWGALIFAIFATFSSLIKKIKLIFIRFHSVKPNSLSQITQEEIDEFSDDDEISSPSSSDDDHDDDEQENEPTTTSFDGGQRRVDDFRVKGLNVFRRRRSCGGAWPEFAAGRKSVVKLWDSFGLSLDFDEDLFNYGSTSVVSTWENEYSGGFWDIPAVVVTAEGGGGRGKGVILGGYDTRMRRRSPAFYAEWGGPPAAAAAAGGGVGRVYVRDDVSGVVTVGDVRNVRRPLESVRETDGETWWDADAVIVENEI